MKSRIASMAIVAALAALAFALTAFTAGAQQKKPNILIIWGDDIGWFNSAPTTWA